MLTKIGRHTLSLAFVLTLAAAAHADTVYNFSRSVSIGDKITASGSFSGNQVGTNLPPSIITGWNIDFSGGGFTNLDLTPSNSTLTFQPGTVIDADLSLSITAPDKSAGFTLSGNVQDGADSFVVEWVFGDGVAEVMSIGVPGGNVIADGANVLSFPATFTTDSVGVTPAVPEPSSLILLGTGGLSIIATGLRRLERRQ
jgi:opacity protein-like surface antigen